MKKAVIITLGCKVCQYESDVLAEVFEKIGYKTSTKMEFADIFVLNSCAVTNESERKSRQMIAKFNKLNSKAKIFVCGCASQNNPKQFSDLPNVKYICGNVNKLSIINNLKCKNKTEIFAFCDYYEDMSLSKTSHTRANVKIQDGCNRFCSYCLIPYLRGRSKSRDIVSILKEVAILKQNGAKEIVIIGIDLSDFKIDGKPALIELLKQLDKFNINIRLGSLEPNLLQNDFLKELKKVKNFCPHFHISMQSGSNSVLTRMNRRYTKEFFIDRVLKIKKMFPYSAITTDIIVGFAGETDSEFQETVETVKKCQFAHTHIFPYSRRSGTACDKMINIRNSEFFLIDSKTVKEREKILQDINKENTEKFLKSQINKTLEVIFEQKKGDFFVGTSKNYVKVYIPKQDTIPTDIVKVKVKSLFQNGVLGINYIKK